MFDDLVVSSANPKKTNKPWTVVLSAMIQAGLLGILILIPLIYTEALPKANADDFPGASAAAAPSSAAGRGRAQNREACGAPDSQWPDDGSHRHPQES